MAFLWPFNTKQLTGHFYFSAAHSSTRRKMQHTNTHVQSHLIYFRYGILPASHSGEEIGLPRTRRKKNTTGNQTATKTKTEHRLAKSQQQAQTNIQLKNKIINKIKLIIIIIKKPKLNKYIKSTVNTRRHNEELFASRTGTLLLTITFASQNNVYAKVVPRDAHLQYSNNSATNSQQAAQRKALIREQFRSNGRGGSFQPDTVSK